MNPWLYVQSTGELFRPDGTLAGKGYAGKGLGHNNPAMQKVRNVGPLPCGHYRIGQAITKHPRLGPNAIPLFPLPETEMFGRSHFYMHGDNQTHTASLGCIIQGPRVRKEFAQHAGAILWVVSHVRISNAGKPLVVTAS